MDVQVAPGHEFDRCYALNSIIGIAKPPLAPYWSIEGVVDMVAQQARSAYDSVSPRGGMTVRIGCQVSGCVRVAVSSCAMGSPSHLFISISCACAISWLLSGSSAY